MSEVTKIAQELVTRFNQEVYPATTAPMVFPLKFYQSERLWKRGDGSRYKDFGRITTGISGKMTESSLPLKARPLFFYWLLRQPEVKYLGKLTDEASSTVPGDTVVYRGVMFVNRGYFTEFASKSRLRNSAVWRLVND